MSDPRTKVNRRLDTLEKEVTYLTNKMEKVLKLHKILLRFFKYISVEEIE